MSNEASAYIFSFDSKSEVFTLTSSKNQLTIDSKHKKYEWLKGQEAGRVIKISSKGRWNSSRDYDNLYQSIKPRKKVSKKSKTTKPKSDNSGEINKLQSTINNLRDKLKRLNSNYNELKKENEALKKEITANSSLLAQKAKLSRPIKKTEKKVVRKFYTAKIAATESYTYGGSKTKRECTIKLETEKLKERPTKSYAKALLRQYIARKIKKYPIKWVSGISDTYLVLAGDYKLTNITILNIEESL